MIDTRYIAYGHAELIRELSSTDLVTMAKFCEDDGWMKGLFMGEYDFFRTRDCYVVRAWYTESDDVAPIGWATGHHTLIGKPGSVVDRYVEINTFVRPEYRRLGVAERLVTEIKMEAGAMVIAFPKDEAGEALYEKTGVPFSSDWVELTPLWD